MRVLIVIGAAAAVGAMCFFLISDFLGTGPALVLTTPAVLFTAFALGVGLR
jgi:hypothetical protein